MVVVEGLEKEIEAFEFNKARVFGILDLCCKVTNEEEAKHLIARYKETNEHAEENLGYAFGYVEPKAKRIKLHKLFKVVHPIFGSSY